MAEGSGRVSRSLSPFVSSLRSSLRIRGARRRAFHAERDEGLRSSPPLPERAERDEGRTTRMGALRLRVRPSFRRCAPRSGSAERDEGLRSSPPLPERAERDEGRSTRRGALRWCVRPSSRRCAPRSGDGGGEGALHGGGGGGGLRSSLPLPVALRLVASLLAQGAEVARALYAEAAGAEGSGRVSRSLPPFVSSLRSSLRGGGGEGAPRGGGDGARRRRSRTRGSRLRA